VYAVGLAVDVTVGESVTTAKVSESRTDHDKKTTDATESIVATLA